MERDDRCLLKLLLAVLLSYSWAFIHCWAVATWQENKAVVALWNKVDAEDKLCSDTSWCSTTVWPKRKCKHEGISFSKKWPQRTRIVRFCISKDKQAEGEGFFTKNLLRKVQEQWLSPSRHYKKWWHIPGLAWHRMGVASSQSSFSFLMHLGCLVVCVCLWILIYSFEIFSRVICHRMCLYKGMKVVNVHMKNKGQSDTFYVNHHYTHTSCWNN